MSPSSIEWTDRTWNPVRGCSRVSEGCRNCYAERQAARFTMRQSTDPLSPFHDDGPFAGFVTRVGGEARWTGRVELVPAKLGEPLSWRKHSRVFVNSMSDLFHEALSFEDIARVFGVMACSPQHTFQILTKRPERFAAWEAWIADQAEALKAGVGDEPPAGVDARASACVCFAGERPPHGQGVLTGDHWRVGMKATWPLPNVWLGVSVEDQRAADERIPLLLETPAAVRFLSVEPMIGPVDLRVRVGCAVDALGCACSAPCNHPRINWVIVGGESGPGARPCDVAWIRSVVEQCRAANVPCFVKQLGARVIAYEGCDDCGPCIANASAPDGTRFQPCAVLDQGAPIHWKPAHPKGGDITSWPRDLRVREFPRTTVTP